MEIAWTVVGITVPAAFTLGYTFVGLTPPDFKRARICFIGAAVALGGMEVVWYAQTGYAFVWRVLIASLICLTIGIGLPETLRWVYRREMLIVGPPLPPPPTPPPTDVKPPTAPSPPSQDTAKELADEIKKALAQQTQKKPCRLDNGQLVDCTDAEVLAWGKPLIARLDKAVQDNVRAAIHRHEQFSRDHNETALNNTVSENATMNRYLEGDYKNLVTYRAALISHLHGGDDSKIDSVRTLLYLSADHGQSGDLYLLDKDSALGQAQFVLRDFQDLSGRLAQQIEEEKNK